MWYEILPSFMVITAGLGLPGLALYHIHNLTLGNHHRRSMLERWDRYSYQRDQRITGNPYVVNILVTLSFYARGSYQRNVGASSLFNMSQPSFSRCFQEVTNAFNNEQVLLEYIKFPFSRREREAIMKEFIEKFGSPGVIGCVDGTPVALVRPKDHEECVIKTKKCDDLI